MVNFTPKTKGDEKNTVASYQEGLAQVSELMDKNPLVFRFDESIEDAQTKILNSSFPGAPVVDEQGKAVGFLSERDCLVRVIRMKYYNENPTLVSEAMTEKCVTISENDDIMKAIRAFSENYFHIIPVVDQSNRIVGMLSRKAVFRKVVKMKQTDW